MEYLRLEGQVEDSRAGKVLVSPYPVTTVYECPWERVLLNAGRDANPFFHFFEGIWMLGGFSDGSYLNRYVSDFTSRFADKDPILHGAYGWRWLGHFGKNQIVWAIDALRRDPTTRRAVINMWDPREDWIASKDIPCNTNIFLRNRSGYLDMMVNCRSNDIIWGAYGANAVHMSMLQEFIAFALGVRIGRYYQNSWNFHAYKDVFDKKIETVNDGSWCTPYETSLHPLVDNYPEFQPECRRWITGEPIVEWDNSIFPDVAVFMKSAHSLYKLGDYNAAIDVASGIDSADWRRACIEWIQRRAVKAIRKDAGEVNYEQGVTGVT